jgi:mono/diheme cytochrome c family protein
MKALVHARSVKGAGPRRHPALGRPSLPTLLAAACLLLAAAPARADEAGQVAHGRALVEQNCARCHAVAESDASPHAEAPALRDLSRRYPLETLVEALGEGISTGHPDMPAFVATPQQINAIIAYIGSLDPR